MPSRLLLGTFAALALALTGCSPWLAPAPAPAPPPPPPVTVTVPAPPPVQQQGTSSAPESEPGNDDSDAETTAPPPSYDNCRWMDDEAGWYCRNSVEGGYFDVPDDDPGLGSCAGLTYDECTGQPPAQPPTGESESGTTSDCTSSDVYDPYECPGDSPHDDGHVDSGEIEKSCRFHGAETEQELQQCTANY
ncbi:hypothetical protein EIL87_11995 [Saccharopolyspora rhizosphaerae]|uniref:Uncharacterized protein n=1 Tax=Saccharopolyspora rhizosphaerae TaxID=2492662 RepID=A0A3R8R2W9_9PSEU|nr:hypothetical protein [Saccharopolyspora rhizosphaerae]RRO16994.1 hypothetical protein EIL87_11995 [Saccharopolyspora rhizosphaerae]